jgi:general nucleoside transport system permease protein
VNDNAWVLAIAASVGASMPIVLATLGAILHERSGVLNLGVEGMMLVGAVAAFLAGDAWGNVWLAIGCGILAGGALGFVHGALTISLRANQIVTGLMLVIFGTGLAKFLGEPVNGLKRQVTIDPLHVSGVGDVPVLGPIVFQQDVLVYMTVVLVVVSSLYIHRTRAGLALRAVGESPATADAQGISVNAVRYVHVVAGGLLAGAGGAYQATARAPSWNQEFTINGLGWIALALVVFANWRPGRALLGALLFGFALRSQFTFQAQEISFPPQVWLQMMPYLLTIVVLIVTSSPAAQRRLGAPAALGVPYSRDER